MTQRRRLDAYLAEQAVAAGARFQDGTRVEHIVHRRGRRLRQRRRGAASRPTCSSAPTAANGVVAKAAGLDAGIVRGVALEGNVPW